MESDSSLRSYLLKTNRTSGKLVKQCNDICSYIEDTLSQLPDERKEQLLDDIVVDSEIRHLYKDGHNNDDSILVETFPKMILQTGQKIVVDCENDFSTWRDEHSGPFSWKSRSQQNLTLFDLEADVINKPLSKPSVSEPPPPSTDLFPWQQESWTDKIISDFKNSDRKIKPANLKMSPLEEVNKGFESSSENISNRVPQTQASLTQVANTKGDSGSKRRMVRPPPPPPPASIKCEERKATPPKDIYVPCIPPRQGKQYGSKPVELTETSPNDDKYCGQSLLSNDNGDNGSYNNPTMSNEEDVFIGQSVHVEKKFDSDWQTTNKPLLIPTEEMTNSTTDSLDEVDDGGLSTSKTGFDFLDQW